MSERTYSEDSESRAESELKEGLKRKANEGTPSAAPREARAPRAQSRGRGATNSGEEREDAQEKQKQRREREEDAHTRALEEATGLVTQRGEVGSEGMSDGGREKPRKREGVEKLKGKQVSVGEGENAEESERVGRERQRHQRDEGDELVCVQQRPE